MNKNQKGFAPVLIIAVIAVTVVAVYFLLTQNGKITTPADNSNYSAIQSAGDLSNAASDLDNIDINQVDMELDQLNSDASSF